MKTTPRLHLDQELAERREIALEREPSHYLAGVLRLAPGDAVAVFNARDGEWLAYLTEVTKKAVRIRCEPDLLHLEVQDNGQGLAPALSLHRGYGLPNIERRVRHLGGEYRFAVPPGGGTLPIARMPLTFAPVAQKAP